MDVQRLENAIRNSKFDEETARTLREFFESYGKALDGRGDCTALLERYIELVREEVIHQTLFDHFHAAERRIGTCRGAAGEEGAPTGGAAGIASSESSAGEALMADMAGLAAGSLPAAEGGGFEAGVE